MLSAFLLQSFRNYWADTLGCSSTIFCGVVVVVTLRLRISLFPRCSADFAMLFANETELKLESFYFVLPNLERLEVISSQLIKIGNSVF